MKKQKYLVGILILGLMMLLTGCGKKGTQPSAAQADSGEIQTGEMLSPANIDIAMVLDTSGSMLGSDPGRVAVEASKLFIDMEKAQGINLCVVEFSDKLKSTGMVELKDQETKEWFKSTLDSITYVNRTHTDTGAGLLQALNELKGMPEEDKKAILLFTDGKTEITGKDRTLEQSLADVEAAVREAGAMGCPIYSVGLNNSGKVDEQELMSMSVRTKGASLVTNNVNELPQFFNEIFKMMGNIDEMKIGEFTADGSYQPVNISVSNKNILEANIVILSDTKIEDIRLYKPDGSEVEIDQSQNIFSQSEKYSVLKLVKPEQGIWHLEVKGVSGDQIQISMLYNYNITMKVIVTEREVKKGDPSPSVIAKLYNEGVIISDEDFYKEMSAVATLLCEKNGERTEIPMEEPYGLDGLSGTLDLHQISDYALTVHMEGQGLYRDSEPIHIKLANQELQEIKKLRNLKFKISSEGSIDLSEFVKDPDENELQIKATVEDKELLSCEVNENNFVWKTGEKRGKTDLTVVFSDGDGSEIVQTVSVNVNTLPGHYAAFIRAIILLLLLSGLLLAIREWRKHAAGYMQVSLNEMRENETGEVVHAIYELGRGIQVHSLGRSFTLKKLLEVFLKMYGSVTSSEKKKAEVENLVRGIISASGGVHFYPTKQAEQMTVVLKGAAAFCNSSGTQKEERKTRSISCQLQNPTVFHLCISLSEERRVVVTVRYCFMPV